MYIAPSSNNAARLTQYRHQTASNKARGLPKTRPSAAQHSNLCTQINNQIKAKAQNRDRQPLRPQRRARGGKGAQQPFGQKMPRHKAKGRARKLRFNHLRQPARIGGRARQFMQVKDLRGVTGVAARFNKYAAISAGDTEVQQLRQLRIDLQGALTRAG